MGWRSAGGGDSGAGRRRPGGDLLSIVVRGAANGAVSLGVYAGAGLAVVLLPLLGYGSHGGARRLRGGLLVLIALAAVVGAALAFESVLLTGELPRLLRGGRLW